MNGSAGPSVLDALGLAALTANCLVALDKCPGVHPIGVGEIVRIISKVVLKSGVLEAAGTLQLCGGHEADGDTLFSQEGTTQGDPLAMAMYAITTVPLIEKLQSTNTKQVWHADDARAGGTLLNLKAWWTMLSSSGPSYGYFVNPGKTWLIVKPQHERDAKELFSGTGIGITSEGKRHLGRDSISDTERGLFPLLAHLGGLALPNPTVSASFEYSSSVNITAPLVSCILLQCMDLPHSTFLDQKQAKATVHSLRQQLHSSKLVRLKAILPPAHVRSMDLNSEKGASSWLSVLPISDHGFALHKGAFHDAMCLRYNWHPPHLPSHCVCGSSFNTDHALTCPTGGFPSVHHNDLRDFTANLLSEICSNVCIEPPLQALTGELLSHDTSTSEDGACLDVQKVLNALKCDRKIAAATHNILAYRLYNETYGTCQQDCDDDGETAAGGRLLQLLEMMDRRDVLVVVSRWFGGILLHGDRFKHINNVARILLLESKVGCKEDKELATKLPCYLFITELVIGLFCVVAGCSNTTRKHDLGVSFHRFPFSKTRLLDCWLETLSVSLPLPHNARVCSAHFQPADFCGLKGLSNTKPRLKEDAVPSLLLNPDPNFAVKRRKIVAVTAANPVLSCQVMKANYLST
ncbi:hypothetical protein EMCRGX_G031690 [Ephydatia muelleri]